MNPLPVPHSLPSSLLRLIAAAALAVVLAGCGLHAEEAPAPPAQQVGVAPVIARTVSDWDEFTGRVSAVETVELRPRVAGYIQRVNFDEGQEVAKDAVLFEIDDRVYRAAFDRARAELSRAQSRADLARSEADRAQRLARSQAISTELLDQRQAALAQAQADVEAARAALASARLDLDFTRVRAPIAGRAGRALVTAGNLASPDSTVLTTLVSLDPVHVYFDADEHSYLRYQAQGPAASNDMARQVRVGLADEQGHPHAGVLDFLDNHVDPATGTIRARAVLDNGERRFMPGLFARVQLRGRNEQQALLIDDKAVLTDQDRKYVYVVGDDRTAQRRDVRLGRLADGLRVVESGLAPGDQVVVSGVQKIFFPGMPVDPQPHGDTQAVAANVASR